MSGRADLLASTHAEMLSVLEGVLADVLATHAPPSVHGREIHDPLHPYHYMTGELARVIANARRATEAAAAAPVPGRRRYRVRLLGGWVRAVVDVEEITTTTADTVEHQHDGEGK